MMGKHFMQLDNKLVYNNTAGIDILNVHLMLTKATSPEEGVDISTAYPTLYKVLL